MEFRPCIDIHNGKVKQIVGGSLKDQGDQALENFVSQQDAAFYARLYRSAGIRGGHIILLNGADSPHFEATRQQAFEALAAYPGGLQVGGGIHGGNAREYLDAGAAQVIVTSYVFHDGRVDYGRLEELAAIVGRERLVLDLSCRKIEGEYRIVTDRWQKSADVSFIGPAGGLLLRVSGPWSGCGGQVRRHRQRACGPAGGMGQAAGDLRRRRTQL